MSDLERWRKVPPPRGSGPTIVKALDQVSEIMALGLADLGTETRVPPRRLASYGMSADASQLGRHPDGRRLATLLATVRHLEAKSVGDTLELLDRLMTTELVNKAQTASDQEKVRKHPRLAKVSARGDLRPVAVVTCVRVAVVGSSPKEPPGGSRRRRARSTGH